MNKILIAIALSLLILKINAGPCTGTSASFLPG